MVARSRALAGQPLTARLAVGPAVATLLCLTLVFCVVLWAMAQDARHLKAADPHFFKVLAPILALPLFFAYCIVHVGRVMFGPREVICVNSSGFDDVRLGLGVLPWTDIVSADTEGAKGVLWVTLSLTESAARRVRISWFWYPLTALLFKLGWRRLPVGVSTLDTDIGTLLQSIGSYLTSRLATSEGGVPRLVVRASRAATSVAATLLTALGGFIVVMALKEARWTTDRSGDATAVAVGLLFLYGAAGLWRRLWLGPELVVIDERGVDDRRYAGGPVPWSALGEAEFQRGKGMTYVTFRLREPSWFAARVSWFWSPLQAFGLACGRSLVAINLDFTDGDAREVLLTMEAHLRLQAAASGRYPP